MPLPPDQSSADLAAIFTTRWAALGEAAPRPSLVSSSDLQPSSSALSQASHQYLLDLAEIGENTARLVHNMRSPLSVILNALRRCHTMPLPGIVQQRLALALEEAERLNRIVEDVITFARYSHPTELHWALENRCYPARSSRAAGNAASHSPGIGE